MVAALVGTAIVSPLSNHPTPGAVAEALLPAALLHVVLTFPRPTVIALRSPGLIPIGYLLTCVPAALVARGAAGYPELLATGSGIAIFLTASASLGVLARLIPASVGTGPGARSARVVLPAAGAAGVLLCVSLLIPGGEALRDIGGAVGALGLAIATLIPERRPPLPSDPLPDTALSLGALSKGMAHALRKPVRALSHQMASLNESGLDPEVRAGLIASRRLLEQIERLVGDILDLARSQSPLQVRNLPADRLVDQAVKEVVARFPECEVGRSVAVTEVVGDELALRRMLVSLIENGAEATGGRGPVRIEVVALEDGVRISVEDEAGGLDSGISDRVFEPFETSKPYGSGLGLPIARELCRAHRGDLWLEPTAAGLRVVALIPKMRSRATSSA